jgi:hypothetical protein
VSEETHDRWEFPSTIGMLFGAGVYLVTTAGRLGLVYYLPREHMWTMDPDRGIIAMDWFFRAFVTFLATGTGVVLGRVVAPSDATRARAWTRLVFGVAVAALAWAAVFTVGFLMFPP